MKFKELADTFEKIEMTSGRLSKIELLSSLISKTNDLSELNVIFLFSEGKIFPEWSQKKTGISDKIIIKVISKVLGFDTNKVVDEFKKCGDLGDVVQNLKKIKTQQTLFFAESNDLLDILEVFESLKSLAELEGDKSSEHKIKLISYLINSSSDLEAKYIVRILIGDIRLGVSTGTIKEAIIHSLFPKVENLRESLDLSEINTEYVFKDLDNLLKSNIGRDVLIKTKSYDEARSIYNFFSELIKSAFDKINDMGKIVKIYFESGLLGLNNIDLELMCPFRCMLMQKVNSVEDATDKISLPFALEFKYDGFRVMVHKKGDLIKLFTRSLEDVTFQFPDVVNLLKKQIKVENIILDGEVLGIDKNHNFLSFQHISQRIKRKYDIDDLIKKVPVVYATWDVLYLDNGSTIGKPLKERRELLINSIEQSRDFFVSEQKIIYDVSEGNKFYEESLRVGNEGVVVKDLNSNYVPGNRVGCWLKIKPIMDPLDVVVVGAEWGEGKRANWLTSFTIAVKDSVGDSFLTIGKVGTGFKEIESDDASVTFKKMTDLLDFDTNSNDKLIKVKPNIVISVAYEEIQLSKTYSSGFALRFPRILSLRDDLNITDVDDINKVKDYFKTQ